MRSSSEPWEELETLLEGRELPSPESRVFKRVRLAGVCRVPAPLTGQAAVRLGEPPATDAEALLEAERERAREEAARRGFEEGYREGWEAALREAGDMTAAAAALLESVERARREALSSLDREVAEMALEVGEKLALQRLEVDPESLLEMVRAVVYRAADRRTLRIRMHPRDLHLLGEVRRRLASSFADVEGLELVEDPGMRPGGCVVETVAGTIDARLETRLDRVRAAVFPEEEGESQRAGPAAVEGGGAG